MDFSTMFNTWMKVLTNPREETFQEEIDSPRATLSTALTWIFIAAVAVGVVSFLLSLTSLGTMRPNMDELLRQNPDIPPEMAEQFAAFFSPGTMAGMMGVGTVISAFLAPVFFLIGAGIFYMIAMLLGGKGDFGRYAYLLASFQAPLSIANILVSFVPLLGGCISLFIGLYQLFLGYLATKVAFNLSSGKAAVVVLTPIVLLLTLMVCLVAFVIFVAASSGSTAP
jgi:hypothetical protein